MRTALFLASAATIFISAPALAQDQEEPGVAQPTGTESEASSEGDAIVVTAQRREQSLAEVPMSITALGGDDLTEAGVVSTLELTQVVPGLLVGRSTTFTQPTIRGVGSRNAASGDEANVATFIDGVYQPDPLGTLQDLANIERIEVLKGPQVTLFGRNTTGGAINIVTRSPNLNEFEGSLAGTIGEFGYFRTAGYISGPIVPGRVAISVSATKFGDDGYIDAFNVGDTWGDYDGHAVRVRTLFQLTDDFSFQINGAYAESRNNALLSGYIINGNSQGRTAVTSPTLNPQNLPLSAIFTTEPYRTALREEPLGFSRVKFVDIHAEWDLGFATLSGLINYGHTFAHTISMADHTALSLSRNEYFSYNEYSTKELVLTSPDNQRFEWLVGINLFTSDARFDPLLGSTPTSVTPQRTVYFQNTDGFAAFAEGTLEAVDNLFLTAGVRYNRDERESFNQINNGAITRGQAEFENISPRGIIRYQFSDSANIYASFSQGFKSGGFNPVTPAGAANAVQPETITAYEIGARADILGGLHLSAAAYYYDYSNLQVSAFTLQNNISVTLLQNAGQATITGLELSLDGRIAPHLSVGVGVNLLDTEISNFANASLPIPRLNAQGQPALNGNVTSQVNVNGNELLRAPKRTLNLNIAYDHELFGGTVVWAANAYFSSRWFADVSNRIAQPAYEIVNASVTWNSPGDRFYVSVFGNNLTDQVYALGYGLGSFGDATQAAKPRWFGGTVGVRF